MMQTCRPVRAKAFKYLTIYKAFALSGRFVDCYYTQGDCPGLGASALSGRAGCDSCHTPPQNSHDYFLLFGALLNLYIKCTIA